VDLVVLPDHMDVPSEEPCVETRSLSAAES
jgi:hypothetical protein